MEDNAIYIRENLQNNEDKTFYLEKYTKDKLFLNLTDKNKNNYIITDNYEPGSPKEKDSDNKFNDLLENNKIINTLRSIKTNASLNIDEVKNMPSLFFDLMEALKKSNLNVHELTETIDDFIKKEKKLNSKIKDLEKENDIIKKNLDKKTQDEFEMKKKIDAIKIEYQNLNHNFNMANDFQKKSEEICKENRILHRQEEESIKTIEYLKDQNQKNSNLIDELQQTINQYKKALADLNNKNLKYKTNQNQLQGELDDIQDKLNDIKNFKQEIKEFQNETQKLRDKVKEFELERKNQIEKEQKLKDEIKNLTAINKKLKTEFKTELNEKISILKELENLQDNQKNEKENHENLKQNAESALKENDKLNNKIKNILNEKEELEKKLHKNISELENFDKKNSDIFQEYNKAIREIEEIRKELSDKKNSNNEIYKITDKYEEEIFNLKCEMNLWKNAFIEIAKYKLINYDDSNSDELVGLDKNYLQNSPIYMKEKTDSVLTYFRSLIEEENYQTSNLKSLKEALLGEQEKNIILKEILNNELILRRKIHNRYMLIRGNLRVMCRIRPFLEENENVSLIKKAFLDTYKISNEAITIKENNREKIYNFDYIFGQKSHQHDVYEEVSLLIQSMMRGNNICIIAYGQTCTGKTYTIQGPNHSNPGIASRAAKELFDFISLHDKDKNKNHLSKLSLSIIEIYNENIYNLLSEDIPLLNIYENSSNNLVISDLNPIKIENFNEAVKLFKLATKLRKTAQNNYNDRSSRSHCIYTFHLKMIDGEKIIRSKLHIIDLAGSERISKNIGVMDENLKKEAISINMSLTALSNVLNSIAVKNNHVPYRDSKLTHFLKESLNENYNILLLLHVSPNIKELAETFSTLEFGNRIVKICKHKTGKEKNK